MLILGHFQIHNTCYTHIFFYVYTSVHNFLKLNYLSAFFRFCGCFSCSREVLRTRRSLKLALNSFENDLHSESYFRKINVKKISKNLYEMANSCVEFRKNSRFSSIFFKIHNFGTHIFLYVYTTHTQLPHMSYSGFQIHNTCYTHVKSCVYMCCVQGSTLMLSNQNHWNCEFST